MIISMKYFRS